METTWSYYYEIVFKISSITGAWPYLKPRTRIFRVTLLTAMSLTIIVPQIALQATCKKDLQCTFKTMTAYLLCFVALLKMYTIQLNIHTIRDLTQQIFGCWKELKTSEEYEIMKSYAENIRRFSLLYSIYCFIAVIIFLTMSLVPYALDVILPLNESRPFLPPYRGYYFVDMQEYYVEILLHAILGWEVTIAGLIAHDCMFVTYVEHVCSMFAVVGFRYEQLLFNYNEKVEDKNPDSSNTYRKRVAFLVHTHREALEYAQRLENIYTIPFAIQMVLVTVGMSISLLQIAQGDDDTLEALRYIFFVFAQLIHLFFISFEGQKLIDHSLQMRDKIYNSSWYNASAKLQKLIIFVMMKSLTPSSLSAGKIYILCLESFTTVLQTSMSYLTVLTSMQ